MSHSTLFRSRRHTRAFTLIELLVVISIIALLIGILLPALGAARASGRRAQCLANVRSQGQATASYVADSGLYPVVNLPNIGYFPLGSGPYSGQVFPAGWGSYSDAAGKSPSANNLPYAFEIHQRPLNAYLLGAQPKQDASPTQRQEVFLSMCPDDDNAPGGVFSVANGAFNDDPANNAYSAYETLGSSYGDITWRVFGDDRTLFPLVQRTALENARKRLAQLIYDTGTTSEIMVASEASLTESIVWTATPGMGFHGVFGQHNAAFADGSSNIVEADNDALEWDGNFYVSAVRGNEQWSLYPEPRPFPLLP
ncbi:MAG: prepilin-type N-terminal cleavage/methylation domain-containing protein [Phycisphaerales bacterium JB063]